MDVPVRRFFRVHYGAFNRVAPPGLEALGGKETPERVKKDDGYL